MFVKKAVFLILAVFGLFSVLSGQNPDGNIPVLNNKNLSIDYPEIIMQDLETTFHFTVSDPELKLKINGPVPAKVNGEAIVLDFEHGKAAHTIVFENAQEVSYQIQDFGFEDKITPIPLWLSILPPLIAIVMALVIREVYSALFTGILVGTFIIFFYRGQHFFEALFNGFFAVIDTYVLDSMMDSSHLSIIIFSMMIGGMVGVITKNGGMKGVVIYLSRFANNARSGQLVTWLLGILIFFDDYANTLVVGNTMRPVTDRLKISREKLAYIVDSTAAPIASIAFVTTWIGAELSYIQDGIKNLGLDETPYDVFLNSLQYSFYPILAIFFMFFLIWKRRDFGVMYRFEKSAREGTYTADGSADSAAGFGEDSEPEPGVSARWYNAFIPVMVVVLGTIAGLIVTGVQAVGWGGAESFAGNISRVIGNADSFSALLWSSLGGVVVAILLSVSQKILNLKKSIDALVQGYKTMLTAVLILVLAWSIALITEHLHTAEFISTSLIKFQLSPYIVPTLTFLLAALVSFSTGSSWGTMAILYPLILPASWLICKDAGLDYDTSISIFHNVVSAVLAGSVLGDHCSPISDTTILSSLASSCNHISHVRTQMPYALTVGVVGILFGTIPAAYGVSALILFPLNIAILFGIVHFVGKKHPRVYIDGRIEA
jgi:Na+/H+ antiporter NhaC